METQNKSFQVMCTQNKAHFNIPALCMCDGGDIGYHFLCKECKEKHGEECKGITKEVSEMSEVLKTFTDFMISKECEALISQKKKEFQIKADKQIEKQASKEKDYSSKLKNATDTNKLKYESLITSLSQNPGVQEHFTNPESTSVKDINETISKIDLLPIGTAKDNSYLRDEKIEKLVKDTLNDSNDRIGIYVEQIF